jgi:adenosine deaminase
VDGIIAGIRDARTDFGISCVLIAAINRMETPELGLEMVRTVIEHPREEVVGIGMDYAEAEHMGFGPEDMREFVLNGIDGSWLDDPTKRRWRREWSREIDALIAQLDTPEPMR